MFKLVNRLITKIRCKKDNPNGEWHKYYCTNDCNTCGYNPINK